MSKWDLIKLKKFLQTAKDTIRKIKRQPAYRMGKNLQMVWTKKG